MSNIPDCRLVDEIVASPNHGARAGGSRVDAIILHYTGLRENALDAWNCDPGGEALRWMCDPESQVSSHYLVHTDGRIVQLVPEERRAWHAGRSIWRGCADMNSCSIGIEIVNSGHAGGLPPYPHTQIQSVIELCRDIVARHSVRAERLLAHSDVAPDRKADPGEHFPWDVLHRAGVGHWVAPVDIAGSEALAQGARGEEALALQGHLAQYGYGIEASGNYDLATERVVRAFQRHFRPAQVDGLADMSTRLTLERLIASLSLSEEETSRWEP